MKVFAIWVAAISTLLQGCVIVDANTLTRADGDEVLIIAATGKGLLPGMCGPYVGTTTETYARLKLLGTKDMYGSGEFALVDEAGQPRQFITQPSGSIAIDRDRGVAILELWVNGKKLPISGKHKFRSIEEAGVER